MASKGGHDPSAITTGNAKGLALLLNVSVRRIQQLTQDGIFPTLEAGVYDYPSCIAIYYKRQFGTPVDEEAAKIERAKSSAEVQLKASKAMMAKLQVDELKGTLHRAEDVAAMTEDLIYEIRGALIALPGRLAIDVAAAGTAAEASEVIRKEVHKIMRELSNYHYDPKKYEERVRARMDWSERDGDDE